MKELKGQKKTSSKGKDAKPWEKMYVGKSEKPQRKSADKADAKTGGNANSGKSSTKQGGKANGGKSSAKPEGKANIGKNNVMPTGKGKSGKAPQYLDFLYLLPKKAKAKELGSVLSFLKKGSLEIWDEECVLEITTENGTITFEDIRDSLEREDEKTLANLRMKQVISCDYDVADRELVRKVMAAFIEKFGGRIGSDTEDFTPFLNTEEL